MTALAQAAVALRANQQTSDLGVVALFSLIGLTLSLVAAHLGFVGV